MNLHIFKDPLQLYPLGLLGPPCAPRRSEGLIGWIITVIFSQQEHCGDFPTCQ